MTSNLKLLRPWWLIPAVLAISTGWAQEEHGWIAPEGFTVSLFADSGLAPDLYTLAIDETGRVTVSSRGFIRILQDTDNDGVADAALPFFDGPRDGAMGLFWEGTTLYFTGDGALRRIEDANRDGIADGTSEFVAEFRTGNEHGTHAIRRGPDGWLYVICGNESRIDKRYATTETSPVKTPVAGALVRFSPDFSQREIVADGFRNPYDFDFTPDGEIITYEADNERCVTLPWYEPTRVYHVIPGKHHGWENPQYAVTWKSPGYWFDRVAPIATAGRGSPTGVECYRHTQFPTHYRGGVFLADWTFGLIYYLNLQPDGSSFNATTEVFLEPEGNEGYAPSDIAVHPISGDLYVSIGGRGTRGGVYRVRWTGDPEMPSSHPETDLDSTRPQRADVRRLLDYAEGQNSGDSLTELVQRSWESEDHLIRWACSRALASASDVQSYVALATTDRQRSVLAWGLFPTDPTAAATLASGIAHHSDENGLRLESVRLLQKCAGEIGAPESRGSVWEGYSRRSKGLSISSDLLRPTLEKFPTGTDELDREISRLAAIVEWTEPDFKTRVLQMCSRKSDPALDIHYLAVFARLSGHRTREMTSAAATILLDLDRKVEEGGFPIERNWPERVKEIAALLVERDSEFNTSILLHPEFGRTGHLLFTRTPGFDQAAAAEIYIRLASNSPEFPWSGDLVGLIAHSTSPEVTGILRGKWEQANLRESILQVLARDPRQEDWDKFRQGIGFPSPQVQQFSLQALHALPLPCEDPERLAKVIKTLEKVQSVPEMSKHAEEISRYIARCVPEAQPNQSADEWIGWFIARFPEKSDLVLPESQEDPAWTGRLEGLDWETGEIERGRQYAERIGCLDCHSGAKALGPDLAGAGKRYTRDDLFRAILEPSRDVPDRYRTKIVETEDGQVYQGSVVYESVDNLLLQVGAEETVRIPGDSIISTRHSSASLMPTGMLDEATDQEIVDLYHYLRSL